MKNLLIIMCALHEAKHGSEVTLGCDELDEWWEAERKNYANSAYEALVAAGADELTIERFFNYWEDRLIPL
jgi:hypothetical protein